MSRHALAAALGVALLTATTAAAGWQPAGDRAGDFYSLVPLPDEPPTLLAVQDGSLWRLPRPDGDWQKVPVPLPSVSNDTGYDLIPVDPRIVAVWSAPRDPSHLVVRLDYDLVIERDGVVAFTDQSGQLLESHDGGETWAQLILGWRAQALAAAPSEPDLLYANLMDPRRHGGPSILVRFGPGERTLVDLALPPTGSGYASLLGLAVDAADPARVYAADGGGGVYVSDDRGESWSEAAPPPDARSIAAHPSIAGTALTGTTGGEVWRTTDGGESWQPLGSPAAAEITDLALDPVDAGRYYAVAGGTAYASDDAGTTWKALSAGLPGGANLLGLAIDPADPSRLFASVDDAGVWVLDRPFPAAACEAGPTTLCLGPDGRFEARVLWQDFRFHAGRGRAVPLAAADTGSFWFFAEDNLELVVKALDGRGVNGHFWIFYGALTNVPFTLVVTDTATGETVGYQNPRRHFASRGDTAAFPEGGADGTPPAGALTIPVASTVPPSPCIAGPETLCLADGRFRVEVDWQGFAGGRGSGKAVPATDDSGLFWFFREDNLELTVKVLDGRPLDGHWWVFYGALTNVAFDLRVTDTTTGRELRYSNPARNFASRGDTSAFADTDGSSEP